MRRRHVRLALGVAAVTMLGASVEAADVNGAWDLLFQTQAGPREMSLTVVSDADKVTATLGETELAGTYEDGVLVLEGKHYSPEAGYSDSLRLEAKLVEGELRGESTWGQYTATFVGTRPGE